MDDFTLELDGLTARIWHEAGVWNARVGADGNVYVAARPTLEETFKDTDRLIYKHRPAAWTETDCRCIMKTFMGEIPEC